MMRDGVSTVNDWPDSRQCWRDKRVIVAGDAGFLGFFVVATWR
jgi:hypothetical protein